MKKVFLSLATFSILLASASADKAADDKAIRALFAAYEKAVSSKNIASIKGLVTADFAVKSNGKTMKWSELEPMMKNQLKQAKSITTHSTIKSIVYSGDKATVSNTGMSTILVENPMDKSTIKVTSSSVSVDTVVKTAKGWKMKFVDIKSEKQLINGKTMEQFQKEMAAKMKNAKPPVKPKGK